MLRHVVDADTFRHEWIAETDLETGETTVTTFNKDGSVRTVKKTKADD
jgi:hypothetical protein